MQKIKKRNMLNNSTIKLEVTETTLLKNKNLKEERKLFIYPENMEDLIEKLNENNKGNNSLPISMKIDFNDKNELSEFIQLSVNKTNSSPKFDQLYNQPELDQPELTFSQKLDAIHFIEMSLLNVKPTKHSFICDIFELDYMKFDKRHFIPDQHIRLLFPELDLVIRNKTHEIHGTTNISEPLWGSEKIENRIKLLQEVRKTIINKRIKK